MDFLSLCYQTPLIMFCLDTEGCFRALNPAAEKNFQRPIVDLLGKPLLDTIDPYSREKALLMIQQTLETGQVQQWELNHVGADGQPLLIEYTTHLLYNQSGAVVGIGAVGQDLAGKLQLTEQLARANQDLEGALLRLEKTLAQLNATQAQLIVSEKMRALGQMVASIAHEVNNPLAFIANNLDFFEDAIQDLREVFSRYQPLKQLSPPSYQEQLSAFESSIHLPSVWGDVESLITESRLGMERIRKIINYLRVFARLDEARLKKADLNDGLQSAVALLRPTIPSEIEIHETYGRIPEILCRPAEINQVFLNLLNNAVQAIEISGVITVSSKHDGDRICVTISDNGCGMDQELLSRLGEPFLSTRPVGNGVGLGLAVSYAIIQAHQGSIEVESEPGIGSRFSIYLPIS